MTVELRTSTETTAAVFLMKKLSPLFPPFAPACCSLQPRDHVSVDSRVLLDAPCYRFYPPPIQPVLCTRGSAFTPLPAGWEDWIMMRHVPEGSKWCALESMGEEISPC